MAMCGWCNSHDHEKHRAGGDGWTCSCIACKDGPSKSTLHRPTETAIDD
ncbi:hypothetical protein FB459_2672 [Yimella lutea]|uniref:Uncharacterized protein n=1 Tax=Yimella lutea TaxID=587872 RepID=A0A542EII3_9MICO|nr:hypothetical protein FB459_2672 [Yimella lutea]